MKESEFKKSFMEYAPPVVIIVGVLWLLIIWVAGIILTFRGEQSGIFIAILAAVALGFIYGFVKRMCKQDNN